MKLAWILKSVVLLITVCVGLLIYSNIVVDIAGTKGIYSISDSTPADAAIILGARVYKSGAPSPVLADRLQTGISLYKAGKVKKLLMTGDHGQTSYDEVNNMRRFALKEGVPEQDIFMDHAGFSTYESMYRARDVFRVNKAIVVTQKFHLPRALFLARNLGIDAQGVTADKRKYAGEDYLYFRELFARTKAVIQLALNSKPKYLGPAIPISGDGQVTKDTES